MFPDTQLETLFLWGRGRRTLGVPREMELAVSEGGSPTALCPELMFPAPDHPRAGGNLKSGGAQD